MAGFYSAKALFGRVDWNGNVVASSHSSHWPMIPSVCLDAVLHCGDFREDYQTTYQSRWPGMLHDDHRTMHQSTGIFLKGNWIALPLLSADQQVRLRVFECLFLTSIMVPGDAWWWSLESWCELESKKQMKVSNSQMNTGWSSAEVSPAAIRRIYFWMTKFFRNYALGKIRVTINSAGGLQAWRRDDDCEELTD